MNGAELPAKDPNLFLLTGENWAFLNERRATPLFQPALGSQLLRTGAILILALIQAVISTLVTVMHPDALTIGISLLSYGFLGIVLANGAVIVLRNQSRLRPGVVLPGETIRGEKLWIPGNDYRLILRYRFSAPGGTIEKGQAEGFVNRASDSMAPLPGTPVRVYYAENGKHYLL